ncbi:MarR family transcriptional regulator [Gordonia sp. NPDC003504]
MVTVIADDGPLTLADIVRRTRHSRATAHAVVSELAARGWVNRSGDGHFTVGPALGDLAMSIAHADPVSRFARPVLEDLAAELAMDCFVARRTGGEVTIVESVSTTAPSRHHEWPATGATMPLRPPVCREFVAWETPEARAAWIARAPAALRTRLGLALDAVRARGVAIERMTDEHVTLLTALDSLDSTDLPAGMRRQMGEILSHLTAIDYLSDELLDGADATISAVTVGAPVTDAAGSVIASVVVCPSGNLTPPELQRVVDAAQAAAGRLSAPRG